VVAGEEAGQVDRREVRQRPVAHAPTLPEPQRRERRVAGGRRRAYHRAMYFDALSFLEDEREAWRPYEALAELSPGQLEVPVAGLDQWSGRDLVAHLTFWLEHVLDVARELALGETSPAHQRMEAEWAARGDALNAEIIASWRALPLADVLERFRRVPGELRGYLTVVPEARWLKNAAFQRLFTSETIDHYAEHEADLRAILDAVT